MSVHPRAGQQGAKILAPNIIAAKVQNKELAGEPITAMDRRDGQQGGDRGPKSRDGQRLVRGSAKQDRRGLQIVRRKLQSPGPLRRIQKDAQAIIQSAFQAAAV